MTEIDLDQWPHLTETQRNFIGFVESRADVDIPSSSYVAGTYEMGDGGIDLLTKYVVYRLSFFNDEFSEAAIMLLAPDKELLTYMPFSPEDQEEDDEDPAFIVSIGDHGSNMYFEDDKLMQARLDKLEMLEKSGVLRPIETDPSDHVPGWSKED